MAMIAKAVRIGTFIVHVMSTYLVSFVQSLLSLNGTDTKEPIFIFII
jgi:hypothetical protein